MPLALARSASNAPTCLASEMLPCASARVDASVLDAAASVGYTKTLLWDIDTIDWKPIAEGGPTAVQISNRVVSGAVNGSVVLMHLGGYETLQALHLMVPGLRGRGFLLTSISDQLDGR